MNPAPPATMLVGAMDVSVGLGFGAVIVNVCALEIPPPGVGLKTVTGAVPAVAMSLARICAWSWVLLTKVVVRVMPFQRTTDVMAKFVPVVVSVKVAPPANALLGAIELRVGTGFVAVIVNLLTLRNFGLVQRNFTKGFILIIAVTERHSRADIDKLVSALDWVQS